jgi:hypothetical protein
MVFEGEQDLLPSSRHPRSLGHLRPTSINFAAIMMELRLSYPNFALIPTKLMHPPTALYSFKKLPAEIRLDIWKQAIEDSPGMIHCIQPFYINHPPLAQACHESRQEIKQYYYLRRSQQEHKDFRFYINYEKDTLYLNHKFNLSGRKTSDLSGALESSMKYYRLWLSPVKFLAINLKEGRQLVDSASGTIGLWSMLYVACPRLETLIIVVDGPVNNRKAVFQKLHNIAGPEDLGSHNKWKWHALLFLYESLLRVQKKGGLRDLKLRIVNIDVGNAEI